ncbi:general stress protein [Corynebacterium kutscheri]|uniref:General stress protein 17M-like domain-containing protein n=1 Tax=Corynebacterium kutscheri TaxID=35755 RepID=A0A0F6R2J5_9CORY|nr:general stress protein [Corynebacterium kutscheri]AKE41698.1 hypothetical protein UL82_07685 [Corynebacterium kutscheri]VEH10025.1 hypothetical membrane protein [Corynebacterium kutscheri]
MPERLLVNPGELQRPTGLPVGSFGTYAEAQATVDMLSEEGFPVNEITIVGVDLIAVERVLGRLSWPRVIISGLLSGLWIGVFFGFILGMVFDSWPNALGVGIFMGLIFGVVSSAIPYALRRGKRDFESRTQIVAGRYDVLCNPENAIIARDKVVEYLRSKAKNA